MFDVNIMSNGFHCVFVLLGVVWMFSLLVLVTVARQRDLTVWLALMVVRSDVPKTLHAVGLVGTRNTIL